MFNASLTFLVISYALGHIYKFSLFSPDVKFTFLDLVIFVLILLNLSKITKSSHPLLRPLFIFSLVSLLSLFTSGSDFGYQAVLVGFLYWFRWNIYSLPLLS